MYPIGYVQEKTKFISLRMERMNRISNMPFLLWFKRSNSQVSFMIRVCLLCLIVMTMTSCKKVFQVPTITNGDIHLVSLTIDDTELTLPLMASNPNSYKVVLKNLDIKIMNENRQLIGFIEPVSQIILIPKDTTMINLVIHMETRKVAKTITRAKNNVVFQISGTTHAKALGIGKVVHFEKRIEMPVKEYLTEAFNEKGGKGSSTKIDGGDFVQITKTKLEYISFSETQFSVHFMVYNPYGLALTLNSFPAILKLNGHEAGKSNLRQKLILTEDTFKTEGDIIFTLDNWKAISSSIRSALTQEFTYECQGKLNFNIADVDLSKTIDFTGKVELNPFKKKADDK